MTESDSGPRQIETRDQPADRRGERRNREANARCVHDDDPLGVALEATASLHLVYIIDRLS